MRDASQSIICTYFAEKLKTQDVIQKAQGKNSNEAQNLKTPA